MRSMQKGAILAKRKVRSAGNIREFFVATETNTAEVVGIWSPDRPTGVPPHVPPHLVMDISHYLGPNTLDDPFAPTLGMLEDLPRILFSSGATVTGSGSWVVTHYEDIREVYQNNEVYSNAGAANFQSMVGETFRMIPLAIDPPEHSKYRILLNPWFSPKAITRLEPQMRDVISKLIDGFIEKGECDLAYDYGRIYPVRVFMNLMGFPQEKLEDFLQWEYAILHDMANLERMKWGISSALAYLRGFIEQVRVKPDEHLTSAIVHGMIDGRPATEDEIIGTVFFLWVGGLDTVAATTALMFRRLALDPKLQQTLRENPDLIPEAIEEFLRMQPIVNSGRTAKHDHELAGVQIKKGDHIMCFNASGNFDPAEFENPREFRLDRASNRHFTFVAGPHRCLGSHLARRELGIALREFLQRVPPFRLKPGADRTVVPGLVAAPRLPVVWG
jgi:cytochrome P450